MADGDCTPVVSIPCKGGTILIDANTMHLLGGRKVHQSKGYAYTSNMKPVHRILTSAPAGMVVDHINGDRLDNRMCNLRVCTHSQNLRNGKPHRDGESKYRGVSRYKTNGRWRAQIGNGPSKSIWLGTYLTEIDAAKAYDRAALARYGEFARLNFPDGIPSQSQQDRRQHYEHEENYESPALTV